MSTEGMPGIKTSHTYHLLAKMTSLFPTFKDVEVPLVIDAQESASTEVVADAAPKKKGLFGLSVTDPQDWITVFLSGVIIYQTIDLIAFYGAKLLGNGSP